VGGAFFAGGKKFTVQISLLLNLYIFFSFGMSLQAGLDYLEEVEREYDYTSRGSSNFTSTLKEIFSLR